MGARPDADAGFMPALRFHRLTPLFEYVVAPGVNVTGLDADASIIARARRRAADAALEIRFDEGRSAALPYADASFDVVLSTLFFHHLSDEAKRETAGEIVRVLRPGGRLVVGDLGRPHDPLMRVGASDHSVTRRRRDDCAKRPWGPP